MPSIINFNHVDPLHIKAAWRDPMPKINLYDGYLADTYTQLTL